MTYTHKAWFSFCPVYFNLKDPETPLIAPRHWSLDPLFWLAEKGVQLSITLRTMLDAGYEPMFALRRVRELEKPITR